MLGWFKKKRHKDPSPESTEGFSSEAQKTPEESYVQQTPQDPELIDSSDAPITPEQSSENQNGVDLPVFAAMKLPLKRWFH